MLREIFTTGFIDKNIERNKNFNPGKKGGMKINNNKSFKSYNYILNKRDIFNQNNKPIMDNKINMIMNRPDYLLMNQNNYSTLPTTSINKPYIYSNEITKNIMTPNNIEHQNFNINEKKINNEEIITKINNINKIEQNSNEKEKEKEKEKGKEIIPEINNKNEENQNNINDSKNKSRTEDNKSLEMNMQFLSGDGIDKLKLLEEYISQIKENSTNINETKIQELQRQKNKLENNVNILSNNIRLNKKKYKDNISLKKNLELEKEKVVYDSNKANKDAFSLMKELPNNRVEIEIMKNQIAQAREETKGMNDYANEIEMQTMEIKDELKKINVKISNIIRERDKISNEINSIKKKCTSLRSKIDKVERSSNDFLYNVEQLAKFTQQNKI